MEKEKDIHDVLMAIDGRFTYEDLYAGHSPNFYRRPIFSVSTNSLSSQLEIPATPTTTTTTTLSTRYFARLVATTTEVHSTTNFNKLPEIIPFTYFYWILVVLAILLALTLIIIFVYYCRSFVQKHRARSGSLTSFYRRGTVNPLINTHKVSQLTAKPVVPPSSDGNSLTPPCPSHSLKSLDDQLYRRNSDVNNSPQIVRHDVFLKEPLSTFSNCTSNLSSASASRWSARSSDPPFKVEQLYESQRASIPFNDDNSDAKNDSLIIHID